MLVIKNGFIKTMAGEDIERGSVLRRTLPWLTEGLRTGQNDFLPRRKALTFYKDRAALAFTA